MLTWQRSDSYPTHCQAQSLAVTLVRVNNYKQSGNLTTQQLICTYSSALGLAAPCQRLTLWQAKATRSAGTQRRRRATLQPPASPPNWQGASAPSSGRAGDNRSRSGSLLRGRAPAPRCASAPWAPIAPARCSHAAPSHCCGPGAAPPAAPCRAAASAVVSCPLVALLPLLPGPASKAPPHAAAAACAVPADMLSMK